MTFDMDHHFLVILGPSNCSSSATVSVPYGVDLGGLVFLWLSAVLLVTSAAGSDRPVWRVVSKFSLEENATGRGLVGTGHV